MDAHASNFPRAGMSPERESWLRASTRGAIARGKAFSQKLTLIIQTKNKLTIEIGATILIAARSRNEQFYT
jgi:hypothetical protein